MGRYKKHIPVRTCISCGAKRAKSELIRLVLDSQGRVVRDDSGKGRGRGAYVCAKKPCWERLCRNVHINKAFRKTGPVVLQPDSFPETIRSDESLNSNGEIH